MSRGGVGAVCLEHCSARCAGSAGGMGRWEAVAVEADDERDSALGNCGAQVGAVGAGWACSLTGWID